MLNEKNIIGKRYGKWVVISNAESIKRKDGKRSDTAVLCKCDCGTMKVLKKKDLVYGSSKSCGCYKGRLVSNARTTHGMTNTRIFTIWENMNGRCSRNTYWNRNYAGRGISVCDEWKGKNGFSKFYEWSMANGYSDSLTIDRIDYNKGYSSDNCRWVDMKTQGNNRRTNRYVSFNGETKTVTQWAEKYGVNRSTVYQRLNRGWSLERSLLGGLK